jgi:hypothetical protein
MEVDSSNFSSSSDLANKNTISSSSSFTKGRTLLIVDSHSSSSDYGFSGEQLSALMRGLSSKHSNSRAMLSNNSQLFLFQRDNVVSEPYIRMHHKGRPYYQLRPCFDDNRVEGELLLLPQIVEVTIDDEVRVTSISSTTKQYMQKAAQLQRDRFRVLVAPPAPCSSLRPTPSPRPTTPSPRPTTPSPRPSSSPEIYDLSFDSNSQSPTQSPTQSQSQSPIISNIVEPEVALWSGSKPLAPEREKQRQAFLKSLMAECRSAQKVKRTSPAAVVFDADANANEVARLEASIQRRLANLMQQYDGDDSEVSAYAALFAFGVGLSMCAVGRSLCMYV